MNEQPQQEHFNVTAADIQQYKWQELIATCQNKDLLHFKLEFYAEAKRRNDAGDDLGKRVYSFLAAVASFCLHHDAKGNPFVSSYQGPDGRRSFCAEDLTERDLMALKMISDSIDSPEFLARVTDILWVSKKDPSAARAAIRAYQAAAKRSKSPTDWMTYTLHLGRAARIACRKGFEVELSSVVSDIEDGVSEFGGNVSTGFLCQRLMNTLLSVKQGDPVHYASTASGLAKEHAKVLDWHKSMAYWEVAGQWYRLGKNDKDMRQCRIEAAECNVQNALQGAESMGARFSATWLARGLEALRQAKASPERIMEIHRLLLEVQKRSLSEFSRQTINLDSLKGFLTNEEKAIDATVRNFTGKCFQDAVITLAKASLLMNVEDLKAQHRKASKGLVFSNLIGSTSVDSSGKVSDTMPPIGILNNDFDTEALRKTLVHQAITINIPIAVNWRIEPARHTIHQEHAVRLHDLRFLIECNPFVPNGHEGIWLRGLQAGFLGDWLVSMSLLIPQVEASMRHVLQGYNVVTSGLDSDGIQKEKDLNHLLWMKETNDIFGPDIVFTLRSILTEGFGCNMRNDFAHGLLPEEGLYQPASVYLWWLLLHLCLHGFNIAQSDPGNDYVGHALVEDGDGPISC